MSWHLTIGETAFFAPAGVLLGAWVSYIATRRNAKDNLEAQKLTIKATREQAAVAHNAALEREERDHKRQAYTELGGHLQGIDDVLNYMVGPVLQTSAQPTDQWLSSAAAPIWNGFYLQLVETMPDCRTAATVYGSSHVRAAVNAIGMMIRALAPPAPFADSPGHWMHVMTNENNGIQWKLATPENGHELRTWLLDNISIIQPVVRYGLDQIRYELHPRALTQPSPPSGLSIASEE